MMLTDYTYHLWTMGCQMNEADSRKTAAQLEALGYVPTELAEDANVVVLNTCVVKQQAEDRIYGRLGSLKTAKEKNPQMTLGLMGCMVGVKEANKLREKYPFVDVFMPPSEPDLLIDLLVNAGKFDDSRKQDLSEREFRDTIQDADVILPIDQRGTSVTAHVPIVLGCSHSCTFCIIPYRRGIERSRSKEDILSEVQSLADQGIKDVTLLGQIVDRYGVDFDYPYELADLLRDTCRVDGIERVRFLTSHPSYMTDKLIDAVAEEEKACPYFELPIQSGNDHVLANMRRGYTVNGFMKVVDRIRKRIPHASINTDIIVGFPGETEEQFMDTCLNVKEVMYDKIHLSKYSERPKTVASRQFPDDVSDEEKDRRWRVIDDLQNEILVQKHALLRGTIQRVLVESRHKGQWRGRNPQNKLVFLSDDRDLLGQTIDVSIGWAGPYSLRGIAADKLETVNA